MERDFHPPPDPPIFMANRCTALPGRVFLLFQILNTKPQKITKNAPFPRRVCLGLVSRRLLVLPIARPLPLLPTPVPGGLAAGGLVVGCAFCVLPPRSLPSLAAPRVPFTPF